MLHVNIEAVTGAKIDASPYGLSMTSSGTALITYTVVQHSCHNLSLAVRPGKRLIT
ncbi:MAG: hypothetical protein KF746_20355 [Chitinophagaceae bacterium]|nr:hypothetical protein [Chitinophagaceae bacterium]